MSWGIELAETGWAPDFAVRMGIRGLLRQRVAVEAAQDCETWQESTRSFVRELKAGPLAIATGEANAQHYEVPTDYFRLALGPRLKYSSCYWPAGVETLAAAEETMLALTCARAQLVDGQRVLELGCGWGSLALWMAETYPRSQITAVSNSATQREYIEGECARRGLSNLKVLTCDINRLELDDQFDRVVSVEMFEHLRNYEILFRKIAGWLKPEGKLFAHVFCHVTHPYPFEVDGNNDWMARHFFTGGIMPSTLLFAYFARDLVMEDHWHVNGRHYARTLEAWLTLHDTRRDEVLAVFRKSLPEAEARRMFHRWRIFYMACSELFGWNNGNHWFVAHTLWSRR